MSIEIATASVTTTGGAGVAAGTGYSTAINGYLLDIYLNFHASAPATTDVAITQDGMAGNLAVSTDSATDVLISPRAKVVDNANAAIADSHDRFPINGRLKIVLAQCDALTDAVVATIRYEKG